MKEILPILTGAVLVFIIGVLVGMGVANNVIFKDCEILGQRRFDDKAITCEVKK